MKVIFASDIHTDKHFLGDLLEKAEEHSVDCVVIGGDITPKELPVEKLMDAQKDYLLGEFTEKLRDFKRQKAGRKIYYDLGNDDVKYNRRFLEQFNGALFTLIHDNIAPFDRGLDIVGYMNVPFTPFGLKDWEKADRKGEPFVSPHGIVHGYRTDEGFMKKIVVNDMEDTIERDLQELSKRILNPFIFVCHAPPNGTALDQLYGGIHVGSVAVRRFIEKHAGDGSLVASFHGHIHESPFVSRKAVDEVRGVTCVNLGQSERNGDIRYAIFNTEDVRNSLETYYNIGQTR